MLDVERRIFAVTPTRRKNFTIGMEPDKGFGEGW